MYSLFHLFLEWCSMSMCEMAQGSCVSLLESWSLITEILCQIWLGFCGMTMQQSNTPQHFFPQQTVRDSSRPSDTQEQCEQSLGELRAAPCRSCSSSCAASPTFLHRTAHQQTHAAIYPAPHSNEIITWCESLTQKRSIYKITQDNINISVFVTELKEPQGLLNPKVWRLRILMVYDHTRDLQENYLPLCLWSLSYSWNFYWSSTRFWQFSTLLLLWSLVL